MGVAAEVITAFNSGKFEYMGNGQHATMYFFFGLCGLIDILVHHKVALPKGIDYAMHVVAFSVEGLLFNFHLHGRTELDVLIHVLLHYCVIGTVIAILVEMRYRRSILAALTRTFFVMLQGTWFWQVSFILYNPLPDAEPWKEDDHAQQTQGTLYLEWEREGMIV